MANLSNPPEYRALCRQLSLDQGIPYTEHWSAGADFLQRLAEHCLRQRPAFILECSSGLSTLILARCCQINGTGRVVSLESGAEYATATRAALATYGLQSRGQVLDAPLRDLVIEERRYPWYLLPDGLTGDIDMLVIDGPPGYSAKHARYPALPMLIDHLHADCTIFLDDAARQDEQELVEMWIKRYPDLRRQYFEDGRGCAVLSFRD